MKRLMILGCAFALANGAAEAAEIGADFQLHVLRDLALAQDRSVALGGCRPGV